MTYLLPADYTLFVEEFRRNPYAMWIMKPTSRSQGKVCVYLLSPISSLQRCAECTRPCLLPHF